VWVGSGQAPPPPSQATHGRTASRAGKGGRGRTAARAARACCPPPFQIGAGGARRPPRPGPLPTGPTHPPVTQLVLLPADELLGMLAADLLVRHAVADACGAGRTPPRRPRAARRPSPRGERTRPRPQTQLRQLAAAGAPREHSSTAAGRGRPAPTGVDLVQRLPAQLGEGQVARSLDGALQRAGEHGDRHGRGALVDLLRGDGAGRGGRVGGCCAGSRWQAAGGRHRGGRQREAGSPLTWILPNSTAGSWRAYSSPAGVSGLSPPMRSLWLNSDSPCLVSQIFLALARPALQTCRGGAGAGAASRSAAGGTWQPGPA
jgi:hypothetical protein